MKLTKLFLIVSAVFSMNVYADSLIQPQVNAQPVIDYVPEGTVVPMLNMQFNCGDCEQNTKIKALVEGAYLDQAELEKAQVDEANKTEFSVTKYRSRGKARFFVGALAGADNITGVVSCNGVEKTVSDTAVSAVNGIESVARNVGKDAYKAMRECVLASGKNEEPVKVQDVLEVAEASNL